MATPKSFVQDLEAEAQEQLASVRAYRTYKGTELSYLQRAKLAIAVIGAYVRLRGTIANEESNRLIATRLMFDTTPAPDNERETQRMLTSRLK